MEPARDTTSEAVIAAPLRGRAALKTHVTLVAGLALCALAFWFELHRALGGNELSWAYVFEWPLLGAFAVYMWWRVLHPATRRPSREPAGASPEVERMRDAWEEHLRVLRAGEADREASDRADRSTAP